MSRPPTPGIEPNLFSMSLSLDFHQLLQRPGVDKMTKEQKLPFRGAIRRVVEGTVVLNLPNLPQMSSQTSQALAPPVPLIIADKAALTNSPIFSSYLPSIASSSS